MTEFVTGADMMKLQENIFKKFYDIEKNVLDKINYMEIKYDKKFQSMENSFDSHNIRINDINSNISQLKLNVDKLPETFKRIDSLCEDGFKNSIKLKSLSTELSNAISKYDKIYLDNLVLPGIIGENCRFKSMKEYIDVNKILIKG